MQDKREIPKSSKRIYSGKLISLREDLCILPNNKEAVRVVVEHPGAVAVIAVKDDKVLLVEQFRYPIKRTTWEVPAGKLDANETKEACAARELEEETGLKAEKMTYLFSYYTTPGFSDEIMHFFLAEGLYEGKSNPDEDEFINVKEVTLEEALNEIGKEKICDAKTILALLWYKKHIMDSR